jgi:lipoate-protein ligase A
MFCINLETSDPFFNLAVEEILLKSNDEEFFILYVNDPCVIIGKHQTGYREINTKFVNENNIPVIRRITGGGTVFHDNGNLNFSFIRHSETGRQVDFRKYTLPVIDFLKSIGVDARFEGKNDLKVEGYKISGNAEHIYHNRVLHHGTLLFRSSLEMLRNSIRKDASCYTSRAVASNPSPVMNLYESMNCIQDIREFRLAMINYFMRNYPDIVQYKLTRDETDKTELLANSKYRTWEWNWAYGPEYSFNNIFEIAEVPHSCKMFINEGIINECSIEGSDQMRRISKKIPGCRHMVSDLSDIFRKENIHVSCNEIYNFF